MILRRTKLRLLALLIVSIFYNVVNGQYVNYGQEPTKIKWRIIETEHYNVIFPDDANDQGQRVAGLLTGVYPLVGKSLNHNHKKWDVVLHTQSTTGLAFVFPAPSRSEWFTMQSQTSSSMEWLNLLSVHETRHMVQQSKIETEMPQILYYLLGGHAAPVIIGAYLPFWFMEGDATCNETALSTAGSGRSPEFFLLNRAQLVERGAFSFDKSYMGSYKNRTPDFYELGYLMVGGSRYLFDKTIWDEVLTNVARKPLLLTPFNRGLKKSIGISKYELYDTTLSYFKQQWHTNDLALSTSHYKLVSKANKYHTNYSFGAPLSNGNYFASKSTLNQTFRFVEINKDGRESKVFVPGAPFLESISAKDSMVVWSENIPNIRWENANKSIVRLLNLNSGETNKFKHY